MARKDTIGNLFQKTEKQARPAKVEKYPLSVYLTAEEKLELADIAGQLGESKHAVLQFAIKEFLRRWDAGEYEIQTEKITKKTIKLS
jgi:hypothetical protein